MRTVRLQNHSALNVKKENINRRGVQLIVMHALKVVIVHKMGHQHVQTVSMENIVLLMEWKVAHDVNTNFTLAQVVYFLDCLQF